MTGVWTIGYEGFAADEWLSRVLEARIEVVADVRNLPLSRRPGFSKRALAARLDEAGIGYVSMRELGAPSELRTPLKRGTMPFSEFAPRFRALLDERPDELDALWRLVQAKRTCLLCWEEDPGRCHRSLVAEALQGLAEGKLPVVDIRRFGG